MPTNDPGSRKTSLTHPIDVSFLPPSVVATPGRLGMTFAPGRKGAGLTGVWDRDLDLDLARLRQDFGTDVLVCLMEDHELVTYRMTALAERTKALGLQLIRLPIPDAGVPGKAADFEALVGAILAHLGAGRTVVVHCRGGLGRTGMVAGACLVALGHAPDAAITCVRETRSPQAIETKGQEAVVLGYGSSAGPGPGERR